MNYPARIPETKEDITHGLLEQPSVAYSNVTVRRAFVVWMYCGQKNRFKDVCIYFHHLEALEEKLSSEYRASSRHHEFHLFSNPPPQSSYLMRNFPNLYSDTQLPTNETRSHDAKILRLGEFDRIVHRSGTTRSEIVEASKMIRYYCKTHMKTLERFLKEFREHTERCGLANTVGNVGSYIKRKIIQADIELEANYATTLEIMKRNDYINNSVDELKNFQYNADRKLVTRSGCSYYDSRSSTKVMAKTDPSDVNKSMSFIEDKMTDRNSDVVMDFINKFHNAGTIENVTKENGTKTCGDFLGNSNDNDVLDELKFRTRRFSGSNFIKKDLLKLRNI